MKFSFRNPLKRSSGRNFGRSDVHMDAPSAAGTDTAGTTTADATTAGTSPPNISIEDSPFIRWSVYLLMAFPLVDYATRYLAHPVGLIWDKVVLVILAGVAGHRYLDGRRPISVRWPRYAGWFLLYGLALVFANLSQPLLTIAGYRIDVYYIFFGLLLPFVIGRKDVVKLLHLGAMVAIVIAIHGVYQYITKVPIPADWVDTGEHLRTRVFSVLVSCNELSAYMALMIPIIGGLALYDTNRWRKWFYSLGLIPCAMTLIFAFSRAGWFSLAFAIIIVAIVFERRLLIVVAAIVVAAMFVPEIHHRITDLASPVYWTKAAQAGRIARWQQAFEAMRSNPLFGVGPGHYGGAMASAYHLNMYSDNYYAKTLGETGIVGLMLFFAMHLTLLRDLWVRVKKVTGRKKLAFIGGLIGLLSVLLHNGLENVFEYAPMDLSYFLYMSLFLVWGDAELKGEDSLEE